MKPPRKDDEQTPPAADEARPDPDAGAPHDVVPAQEASPTDHATPEEPEARPENEAEVADEAVADDPRTEPEGEHEVELTDAARADDTAATAATAEEHPTDPAERDARDDFTAEGPYAPADDPRATALAADRDDERPEATAAAMGEGAADRPPETEPGSERPAAPAASAPAAEGGRSRGGFGGALFGGLIAGLIGAAAVWFVLQQQATEDADLSLAIDEQTGRIAGQDERLAAIEEEVAALGDAVGSGDTDAVLAEIEAGTQGQIDTLTEGLAAIDARLADIEARLTEGEGRIGELEARPIADPDAASDVLASEIDAMRQQVAAAAEEVRAEVDAMRAELTSAAEAAREEVAAAEARVDALEEEARREAALAEARAALTQVRAALDTGEPYVDPLQIVRSETQVEVPEGLAAPADEGVPTLNRLRDGFPEAARAALRETAVATSEGDPGERLVAFLRAQTQARSLAPQAGDSADAILSRAEAALEQGEVQAAIDELQALPEDARAAMQSWIDQAQTRVAATEGAAAVAEELN